MALVPARPQSDAEKLAAAWYAGMPVLKEKRGLDEQSVISDDSTLAPSVHYVSPPEGLTKPIGGKDNSKALASGQDGAPPSYEAGVKGEGSV